MRNIEAGGLGRAPNAPQNGVPWSEGRIPFQRIVSCLRQIASNIYLTKFTPQNASAKHYSTGERVHAARGLLGSDQQFVSWKGRWWKRRTNGEKIRGFSRSLRFPPQFSFLFFSFFPSLPLFHVQQAFTIEKATHRRAKRRWTIENRNFVFARKNKIPLLVFHGDREERRSSFFSGRKI